MNIPHLLSVLLLAANAMVMGAALAADNGQARSAAVPVSASSSPAAAASVATSAIGSASVGAGTATPLSNAQQCPSPEMVFGRVRQAAKLNTAENTVIDGGLATEAAEVVSNILGFGSLFNAASVGAELSAHKKIADAIAADPCGDRVLQALPKSYRALYEGYMKNLKNK